MDLGLRRRSRVPWPHTRPGSPVALITGDCTLPLVYILYGRASNACSAPHRAAPFSCRVCVSSNSAANLINRTFEFSLSLC